MLNKNLFVKITYLLIYFFFINISVFSQQKIMVGAEQIDKYFDLIQNKNVAIVCNQTSVFNNSVKKTHLVDSLIKLKIKVVKVFSPEHGFKGNADNGEYINDEIDSKTKIKIISL